MNTAPELSNSKPIHQPEKTHFFEDVFQGLMSEPKYLESKYFYDDKGDEIFQRIMHTEEYYLTKCELEIFQTKCAEMVSLFDSGSGLDLIELGAGDAFKSSYLLDCLLKNKVNFNYYPIDISAHTIDLLETELPQKFPDLKISGLTGEYFDMLEAATKRSSLPKVVLFLGSNIGNMSKADALKFTNTLRSYLNPADLVLMGVDLKKDPKVIFNAYNDKGGVTKAFNLNLLDRINHELNADFDTRNFDHFESYDPETGSCKSYLYSLIDQKVYLNGIEISFAKNEYIFMEISQKYTIDEINQMAKQNHFETVSYLFDSRKWFTDVIWKVI